MQLSVFDDPESLRRTNLDNIDLKILNLLAINGRLSYRSIGITIGLTTKSVKSRVDRMLSSGVIDKFLAVINPSIIGYGRTYTVALRKSKLNQELVERITLVGDIQYRFEMLGGVVGFGIAVKGENEDKVQLLLNSLRPAIVGMIESRNHTVPDNLTKIDYSIIRAHKETKGGNKGYRKGDFSLSQNYPKEDGKDD